MLAPARLVFSCCTSAVVIPAREAVLTGPVSTQKKVAKCVDDCGAVHLRLVGGHATYGLANRSGLVQEPSDRLQAAGFRPDSTAVPEAHLLIQSTTIGSRNQQCVGDPEMVRAS